jgi:nicotinate dehydrogenase subunit B
MLGFVVAAVWAARLARLHRVSICTLPTGGKDGEQVEDQGERSRAQLTASLDTPLLYVLHNELHLHGPRFGCGLAQCGACSVLLDGKEVRSCVTPVAAVSGKAITTLEGLPAVWSKSRGTTAATPAALHPLQQAWIDVQVPHCGYCQNGMMIQAADLLATTKRDRGADSHGDERSPLPLRHLSENPDRDSKGGGRDGEGRHVMSALQKELSRASFLKRGGALVVGFSVTGAGLAGRAGAAESPFASNGPTDLSQVDSFIAIHSDNTASIMPGGGEHGTGTSTGWLMLAAEELEMDLRQVKFISSDTNVTPINVGTFSSMGTKLIGPQVRAAAAYAKQALLGLASTSLGVPVASLTVSSGVVSGGGRSVTYGQLIGERRFNITIPGAPKNDSEVATKAPTMLQGLAPLKPVGQYKLVGTAVPRVDIPEMVAGRMTYSYDIKVPGMLHGRLVWPRGQGAYGAGAKPLLVDERSIRSIPGARVVRRGDFLGVVAPSEYHAVQAAAQLKVRWADPPKISGVSNLWKQMREHDSAGAAPARYATIGGLAGPVGNVDAALKAATHVLSQSYSHSYELHGPIGPGVAVADVTPSGALVLCHTQAPARLRGQVAEVTGLPENVVRIKSYPGSSTYGEAMARRDPGPAAAIMSQIIGKPVRVQFMRWDEHGWDNFGPPHLVDLQAGIDGKGNIVAWDYSSLALPYVPNGSTTRELAGLAVSAPGVSALEDTANGMQYNLPNWRVTAKTLPLVGNYFKTSNMRASHSSQTTWATEIMVDELAYAAGIDPIDFRRLNVSKTNTERYLGVLDALATASSWQPRVAASSLSDAEVVSGRGISAGPRSKPISFSGVVVQIDVNKKTGKILVKHVYGAQDQGLAVNPRGVEDQIVGQIVMSTSRALHEQVRFNTERVTSVDWVTYPILRFKDAPKVTPIVITRPNVVMSGAGDYTNAHVPAAIANAFFDATGVRIRRQPMTPAVVRAVLKDAGTH